MTAEAKAIAMQNLKKGWAKRKKNISKIQQQKKVQKSTYKVQNESSDSDSEEEFVIKPKKKQQSGGNSEMENMKQELAELKRSLAKKNKQRSQTIVQVVPNSSQPVQTAKREQTPYEEQQERLLRTYVKNY